MGGVTGTCASPDRELRVEAADVMGESEQTTFLLEFAYPAADGRPRWRTGHCDDGRNGRIFSVEQERQARSMKRNPGTWCEQLFETTKEGEFRDWHSVSEYGEETAARVLERAQEYVSSFSLVIGTAGTKNTGNQVEDMAPASGVAVRLRYGMYGVLTAGHVLNRRGNTKHGITVTLLSPQRHRKQSEGVWGIDLPRRQCTVVGFDNVSKEGPDIAIIPLTVAEWRILNGWGMVAYDLEKERWSHKEKAELAESKPWALSIINGVRYEASKVVHRHTNGIRGSMAIMATNTRVEDAIERNGYDYVELPSETTDRSYPTRWRNELPGTAAQEIEQLNDEGVTRDVWGGTSGAGVWNLAIGTSGNGIPDGRVVAILAGVCFYADPIQGCIIAHGTKSVRKIARKHAEEEAVRYHSKT